MDEAICMSLIDKAREIAEQARIEKAGRVQLLEKRDADNKQRLKVLMTLVQQEAIALDGEDTRFGKLAYRTDRPVWGSAGCFGYLFVEAADKSWSVAEFVAKIETGTHKLWDEGPIEEYIQPTVHADLWDPSGNTCGRIDITDSEDTSVVKFFERLTAHLAMWV
jgi:hypothetical protein